MTRGGIQPEKSQYFFLNTDIVLAGKDTDLGKDAPFPYCLAGSSVPVKLIGDLFERVTRRSALPLSKYEKFMDCTSA